MPGFPTPAQEQEEGPLDFWNLLAPSTQAVMARVAALHVRVTRVEHVLLALLEKPGTTPQEWPDGYDEDERAESSALAAEAVERARRLLGQLGVDADALSHKIHEVSQREPQGESSIVSRDCRRIWQVAADEARAMNSPHVWPEHVLLAILSWGAPRSSWSVWPLKRDGAAQVLEGIALDLNVARVLVRDLLGEEVEAPRVFSARVEKVVTHAHELCIKTHCGRIAPAHLLLALLRDDEDARDALKYLRAPVDVDLEALRADVRGRIVSDGEASTSRARFTRESARVLDKSKTMAQRAGLRAIDEPILLLNLAMHGGEQAATLRQVLGGDAGRLQLLGRRLYAPPRLYEQSGWGWPQSTKNQTMFCTSPLCWAIAVLLFLLAPSTDVSEMREWHQVATVMFATPFLLFLIYAPGLIFSHLGPFKRQCQSFLSGFLFAICTSLLLASVVTWMQSLTSHGYLPRL